MCDLRTVELQHIDLYFIICRTFDGFFYVKIMMRMGISTTCGIGVWMGTVSQGWGGMGLQLYPHVTLFIG